MNQRMTGSVERPGEKNQLQPISGSNIFHCHLIWIDLLLLSLRQTLICVCRAAEKKDEEKQRSYKQKKKPRRIKVQDSSSSNEKVFKTQCTWW